MKIQFIKPLCLSLWKEGESFEEGLTRLYNTFKDDDEVSEYNSIVINSNKKIFLNGFCDNLKEKFIKAGVFIEGIGFTIPKGIYDVEVDGYIWKWNINGVNLKKENILLPHPVCNGESLFGDLIRVLELSEEEKKNFKSLGLEPKIDEIYYSKIDKLKLYMEDRKIQLKDCCRPEYNMLNEILLKMDELEIK